jgi:hypothetical protein
VVPAVPQGKQNKTNQIKSNQIKSNQIKTKQNKTKQDIQLPPAHRHVAYVTDMRNPGAHLRRSFGVWVGSGRI